jgi:hypothetical protein
MLSARFSLAAITAAVLLAACAQPAAFPSSVSGMQYRIAPNATVRPCKGQENYQDYASLTVKLKSNGGAFCIPEYGGFGGKVQYPGATPSVKLQLISSTTDYDNLPQLGSGSALFYLQLAISGATRFASSTSAGGGLTSQSIVPGDTYTAFGEAVVFSYHYEFPPCYAVATKGKYGGVIGGLGTLLKGVKVPAKGSGFIEIYSGQQSSTQC